MPNMHHYEENDSVNLKRQLEQPHRTNHMGRRVTKQRHVANPSIPTACTHICSAMIFSMHNITTVDVDLHPASAQTIVIHSVSQEREKVGE
jgi:hypothetical protein